MKTRKIKSIETPYEGIDNESYQIEKRRLQVELLSIQQEVSSTNKRMAIIFEGRDAAGKGSTIKRFTEFLIPANFNTVALGVPSKKESKNWFRRYENQFPSPGNINFFDRSWYNRALIEPTMGYCTESQYRYFMKKVLSWEHQHIDNGLLLVKFYISIDEHTQLIRFNDRLNDPLTYWKFSENDLKARKKWSAFTFYKEQMFAHTSSKKSPWIVIEGRKKREARLTAMLHLVRLYGNKSFRVLTGEQVKKTNNIEIDGVTFNRLNIRQRAVLEDIKKQR